MTDERSIFLLMGQSNMAGRGRLSEVSVLAHPHVLMLREDSWGPATEPLHTDKPEIAGVGLGMSFALELMRSPAVTRIGLVPCAVGGTPLNRWMPGGDLYVKAVSLATTALKGGVLKGILWHQGEGDSGNPDDAASYGERFQRMICSLRSELSADSVPVVAGELGSFLRNRDEPRFFERVNRELKSLEEVLPAYACVDAKGLVDNGDNLHFDAASLREFGLRYAKAYCKLIAPSCEKRTM